jgi:hypothetical protein
VKANNLEVIIYSSIQEFSNSLQNEKQNEDNDNIPHEMKHARRTGE